MTTKQKTPRATPNKLTMVAAHKLVSLLLADFTEKRLSNAEYAKYATQALGFEVTPQQVATRVAEFEIPKGEAVADPDLAALAATVLSQGHQISDLMERMVLIEAWVRETFPSKGLRSVV